MNDISEMIAAAMAKIAEIKAICDRMEAREKEMEANLLRTP